jgi:AraC-like DNA-binding protein
VEPQHAPHVIAPTRRERGKPSRHVTARSAEVARVPSVVALVSGRRERSRVQEALRDRMRVEFASTLEEMRVLARGVDDGTLLAVLVEARDADGAPTSALVRVLVAERPSIPVVAICEAGAGLSRDLLDLAQAGTHEVVIRGLGDDGHALRHAIETGQRTSAGARTMAMLAPSMPTELRAMVELCVYYPEEAKTVTRVARALGVHRKTLVNHCTRAGFPPPGVVINWCRVLHAAVLLSTTARPVDQIARMLAFPSPSAFRNLFRRYAGAIPSDVRDAVGLKRVVERWRESSRD